MFERMESQIEKLKKKPVNVKSSGYGQASINSNRFNNNSRSPQNRMGISPTQSRKQMGSGFKRDKQLKNSAASQRLADPEFADRVDARFEGLELMLGRVGEHIKDLEDDDAVSMSEMTCQG